MSWRDMLPEIRRIAEDKGLVLRRTEFFEVSAHNLYSLAARGLPGMYPHWSFGRNYERERTRHDRGRGTIYELVVNLDPAQAFLLDQNSDTEQIFVAAHVLAGHVDLFGRNVFHLKQRLDMDRVLVAAGLRFSEYEDEFGETAVENVIDTGHMLMWHATDLEPAEPGVTRDIRPDPYRAVFPESNWNPDSAYEQFLAKRDAYRRGIGERDLIRFLLQHAPLEDWQRDVLSVVRQVALYFLPQTKIKVLAEGWSSFWHKNILRELKMAQVSVLSDALLHAGVAGSAGGGNRINPYWLGMTILDNLNDRGIDIREIVREESDASLLGRIDEQMVYENDTLRAAANQLKRQADEKGAKPWEYLRDRLVAAVPARLPTVEVQVADWDRGRLVLEAAVPVDEGYARQVMKAMARMWHGQVRLVAPGQELSS